MTTIHTDSCPICSQTDLHLKLKCIDNFASKEQFEIYTCKNCGFAFTQDFPSENEIGKYYDVPEYVSHSDTHKGIINSLYHLARKIALRSKSKMIIKYSSEEGKMLLDIGCGTGYFLNKMKELKWYVTGIEKAEGPRNYAKEKFGLNCHDSDYLFSVSKEGKDVVTMWHVLEHLEQLNKTMSQLHKILKKDGTLFIALPNKDSYDAQSYKENWAAYDVPRHLWHFSPADFELLANKHNFELIATKPMYFDAFYISMLSEKNKGTIGGSLIGLMKGGIFFLRSLGNKKKCSSLIYILKKK